jgi:hypothetical protein
MPIDLLRVHAGLLANLLITRLLIVGFVWIYYGWVLGIATAVVWVIASRLSTSAFYDGMIAQIQKAMAEDQRNDAHHDDGHTG